MVLDGSKCQSLRRQSMEQGGSIWGGGGGVTEI